MKLSKILITSIVASGCLIFSTPDSMAYGKVTDHPVFHTVQVLEAAVLYNDDDVQFRLRFQTDSPSWYHRYWIYEDGEWKLAHQSNIYEMQGEVTLYEDRISIAIDDGSVPEYDTYGGYLVARSGTRSYPDEIPAEQVLTSPVGERGYGDDVRKYIGESRDPDTKGSERFWAAMKSEEELDQLREGGVFINTWQWRAHRSAPIGYADQGYVLEYRNSGEGRGMYADNWDDENNRPLYMYDFDEAGLHSLRWEFLNTQNYQLEDYYYLSEDIAIPFDENHEWMEGDILPALYLREPSGSRGAVSAKSTYENGFWQVHLTRSQEAPNPLDSKSIQPGNNYNIQFGVHTLGTGERFHLVSMPISLSLDGEADLMGQYVDGNLHDAVADEYIIIPVFYPGIVMIDELREEGPARENYLRALEDPFNRVAIQEYLNFVHQHEAARMETGY